MYVLTINDNVVLGPISWNARMFNSALEDELEVKFNILPSHQSNVPLVLSDGVKVRECVEEHPPLNPKIQMYNGPFWTFTDTLGTASYVVLDKPLDLIKKELKEQVASNRWKQEGAGTKVTIQGVEVTVDTSRGNRDVFVQQLLLMPDADTVGWKFPETWLTLTKAELGACVAAGVAHVQAAFGWEKQLNEAIDACTDTASLDALDIKYS